MRDSKILFIDVIRAIAAIMVVVIHVSSYAVDHFLAPQYKPHLYWWAAAFVNASSREAVPLFVLVSGYLLLGRCDTAAPWGWVKKRLFRILIPLIAWIAIYFLWRQLTLPGGYSAMEMLRDAVRGDPYYHLWFLYMLIGLYLTTPILGAYLRGADQVNIKYFVVLWFLFTAIPPFINRALYINQFGLSANVVSGFVGYFMLGHLMRDIALTRKQCLVAGLAIVLSVLATTLGTYLLMSRADGKADEFFFSPMSPTIMVGTLGVFALVKSISWESVYAKLSLLRPIIEALSATSFFLYLSHPLFLDLLRLSDVGYFSATTSPIAGIPITVAVITLMAVSIRLVLSKVPMLDVKTILG